jgi:4-nitrophenyl phosphatase
MITKLIPGIRGLILDMDGVLWRDQQPIGDLPSIFRRIESLGLNVTLATNNATRSTDQFVEKLEGFGVRLEPWQIITSAQATVFYLRQAFPPGGEVYVVGEIGLVHTLEAAGYVHGSDNPLAVIVGLDRSINYEKLCKASLLIRSGIPFIATNTDPTLPTPEGLVPGAGAIVGAIRIASGVDPVIIGKPSPMLYTLAIERMRLSPHEVLVVGDRLDTDIFGAHKIGCRTALVLSGATSSEIALAAQPQPDIIAEDLSILIGIR